MVQASFYCLFPKLSLYLYSLPLSIFIVREEGNTIRTVILEQVTDFGVSCSMLSQLEVQRYCMIQQIGLSSLHRTIKRTRFFSEIKLYLLQHVFIK